MGLFRKRCKTFGCPNLHTNAHGYCDGCKSSISYGYMHNPIKPVERKDDRPSASERGYDHSWHKFARTFLQSHPVCALCGSPAQCVDHKDIPAEIMMDMHGRFDLDPDQYQGLCYSCNTRKTKEDRRKIQEYFSLKSQVTPGAGSKTITQQITAAHAVSRDIDGKNFLGD